MAKICRCFEYHWWMLGGKAGTHVMLTSKDHVGIALDSVEIRRQIWEKMGKNLLNTRLYCLRVYEASRRMCFVWSLNPNSKKLPWISAPFRFQEYSRHLELRKCLARMLLTIWASAWDFQQCGILTRVDSDEPLQPPFKLRNSKRCSVSSLTIIECSSD